METIVHVGSDLGHGQGVISEKTTTLDWKALT
jgi:hypothetical protein